MVCEIKGRAPGQLCRSVMLKNYIVMDLKYRDSPIPIQKLQQDDALEIF